MNKPLTGGKHSIESLKKVHGNLPPCNDGSVIETKRENPDPLVRLGF